jgi:hypothetical protein
MRDSVIAQAVILIVIAAATFPGYYSQSHNDIDNRHCVRVSGFGHWSLGEDNGDWSN